MMARTIRECLWYLRGAACRRLGPYRNLASFILLLVICLFILSSFHVIVFEGQEELSSGILGIITGSSTEGTDGELGEEGQTGDYTDTEQRSDFPAQKNAPNAQAQKRNKRRGFVRKGNMGNKKKRPIQPLLGKNDDIRNRKDKLMFRRTDLEKTNSKTKLLPGKPKSGSNNYQEDTVIGDEIEWSLETEKERRRELRQRSQRVRRECQRDERGKLNRRLGPVYEHLNWVTRYNLIWCPIFKAGSTTWMKNLLLLAGETSYNGSIHYRTSQLYQMPSTIQRKENQLENSLKFMIVRHPFDRLLSAYRDKMLRTLKSNDPYRRLQLLIIKNYMTDTDVGNATMIAENKEESWNTTQEDQDQSLVDNVSSGEATHPTFLQFLYKVRDDLRLSWEIMDATLVDPHWTPYWYTCAPCQIHYDIIAQVETLALDQEFLIRAANLQGVLVNARTHASKFDGYTDSESAERRYFSQIPVDLLKELEELYRPDFKLFGYTAEKYIKMAKSSS